MVRASESETDEWVRFPEGAVRFPVELGRPDGFRPEVPAAAGGRLPPHPSLPGLTPEVDAFFRQRDRA
jgi:hypothetical protein